MPDGASNGLPAKRRLRDSREFLRIKNEGQRLIKGCLIANWALLPEKSESRLGVITSRKLGGAAERSRARRLMRESFRLCQNELRTPVSIILIARASILGKRLDTVQRDFWT